MLNGKLIITACGGAGINTIYKSKEALENLGEHFAEVEIKSIDTSNNNISVFADETTDFFKIENSTFDGSDVAGAGGNRGKHLDSIIDGVNQYLNKNEYFEKVTNEIHIVVASSSGATGNIIQTALVDAMIEKGITVIPMLIVDHDGLQYAEGSKRTLASFNNIAESNNYPLPISIFRNQSSDTSTSESKKMVDADIGKFITILAVLFSGTNHDIDFEDIHALINQSDSSYVRPPSGLYTLDAALGVSALNSYGDKAVAYRTVFTEKEKDINLQVSSKKIGYTEVLSSEETLADLNTDSFSLVYSTGEIEALNKDLDTAIAAGKQVLSKVKSSKVVSEGKRTKKSKNIVI